MHSFLSPFRFDCSFFSYLVIVQKTSGAHMDVCDVVLFYLCLRIVVSSVLRMHCCKWVSSEDRKDLMNPKSPNIINT